VLLAPACRSEINNRPGQRLVVELLPLEGAPGGEVRDDRMAITENDFRRELARTRLERDGSLHASAISAELRQAILTRMIDRRLLAIEASKKGVKASTAAVDREVASIRAGFPRSEFEKQLIQTYQTETELRASIAERLAAAALLKQEAFALVKVSDDHVRAGWDRMPEHERMRPARVHAAQIVLRTEEDGRAVIEALKRGEDFAALAHKRSISPEAEHGGDLGWFEAGVMPTVFDQVCFSLKPGQVSELTGSGYGFHVFKVIEAEKEHPLTFEEARPAIRERLREEGVRAAEGSYLEMLRSRVRIVRNEELIPKIE
jgi:parvulin-like peptidyl-prolyl isomerase